MEYMNLSEAAKALQLSVPTVKRYIYEGKLRSAKLPGGQHRIANSEIERLLSAGDQLPTGEAPAAADARVEVLERWVTDLQEEVVGMRIPTASRQSILDSSEKKHSLTVENAEIAEKTY